MMVQLILTQTRLAEDVAEEENPVAVVDDLIKAQTARTVW
jgi:hypothetical protein